MVERTALVHLYGNFTRRSKFKGRKNKKEPKNKRNLKIPYILELVQSNKRNNEDKHEPTTYKMT